jgi:hypothetical protein
MVNLLSRDLTLGWLELFCSNVQLLITVPHAVTKVLWRSNCHSPNGIWPKCNEEFNKDSSNKRAYLHAIEWTINTGVRIVVLRCCPSQIVIVPCSQDKIDPCPLKTERAEIKKSFRESPDSFLPSAVEASWYHYPRTGRGTVHRDDSSFLFDEMRGIQQLVSVHEVPTIDCANE